MQSRGPATVGEHESRPESIVSGVIRRLTVTPTMGGPKETFLMMHPYAIIGRAQRCDIRLDDLSYRHAYLQVMWGRVACIDLCSTKGAIWPDGRSACGWLELGAPVLIGSHSIELVDDGRGNGEQDGSPTNCNPLEQNPSASGQLLPVELELLNSSRKTKTIPITRPITRVGRHKACELSLHDESVSRVHCSFVLTARKFWVIDLLSSRRTRVNGERVESMRALTEGDEVAVGGFRLRVHLDAERRATLSSKSNSMSDPESVLYEEETAIMPSGHDSATAIQPVATPPQLEELPGFGEVFKVARYAATLIITPAANDLKTPYTYLQTELGKIEQIIRESRLEHVLFDLGEIEFAGSELIGVINGLSKQLRDAGGQAMICSADYKVHRVLSTMRLFDLWPYHDTRRLALESVYDRLPVELNVASAGADEDLSQLGLTPQLPGTESAEPDSRSPQPDAASASSAIDSNEADWLGSMFAVNREGDTLVVTPLIRDGCFEYTKLRIESSALAKKLSQSSTNNLILDLGQLQYFGSEVIGVLVSLARKTTDNGGTAVICSVTDTMQRVLRNMRLEKLWPIDSTRERAMQRIYDSIPGHG